MKHVFPSFLFVCILCSLASTVCSQYRLIIGNEFGKNVTVVYVSWRGTELRRIIIPMGGKPYGIWVVGDRLFVACAAGEGGQSEIEVYDLNTLAELYTLPIGGKPFAVAVTKDGKRLFVTNQSDNTVWTWDLADKDKKVTIVPLKVTSTEWGVMFCTLSEDDKTLFVTGQGENRLYRIDVETLKLTGSLRIPSGRGMAIRGKILYLANEKPTPDFNTVNPGITAIDTETLTVIKKLELDWTKGGVLTVALNALGDTLYVAQTHGPLLAVDTATFTIKAVAKIDSSTYHYGVFCFGPFTGLTSQAERGEYPSSVKIYRLRQILSGPLELEMVTAIQTSGGGPYLFFAALPPFRIIIR